MFSTFLAAAISLGVVYLYGCLGEIITEKAGHLNLGIPGIMCLGATGGCYAVSLYMNAIGGNNPNVVLLLLLTVFGTSLFAVFGGMIYAFLTVSLRCNQNITGLTLTTFGSGLADFMMASVVDRTYLPRAGYALASSLPFAGKLGGFGTIFLSHGVLVYLAIFLAIAAMLVFNRTKVGLNLRAVGENPAAADAVGIDVTKYKYAAIAIGSAIAGMGGSFYILDFIKGSWENSATVAAMGWIAIALVIFSLWRPALSIFGAILFGALTAAPSYITGISFSEMKLLKVLPYVVTVIVLIITSIRNSRENQGPAAIGVAYFREER